MREQRPRPHAFNILAYVPPDWRDSNGYSNLRDFMHVPVSCALAMAEEQSDQVYNALNRISMCQDNEDKPEVLINATANLSPKHATSYDALPFFELGSCPEEFRPLVSAEVASAASERGSEEEDEAPAALEHATVEEVTPANSDHAPEEEDEAPAASEHAPEEEDAAPAAPEHAPEEEDVGPAAQDKKHSEQKEKEKKEKKEKEKKEKERKNRKEKKEKERREREEKKKKKEEKKKKEKKKEEKKKKEERKKANWPLQQKRKLSPRKVLWEIKNDCFLPAAATVTTKLAFPWLKLKK
jgi:hypothetical protein